MTRDGGDSPPLPGYPTASPVIPDWRTFERGYPLPPGFDPIRPQMTRLDPMLKASAEGRKPKKPRGA